MEILFKTKQFLKKTKIKTQGKKTALECLFPLFVVRFSIYILNCVLVFEEKKVCSDSANLFPNQKDSSFFHQSTSKKHTFILNECHFYLTKALVTNVTFEIGISKSQICEKPSKLTYICLSAIFVKVTMVLSINFFLIYLNISLFERTKIVFDVSESIYLPYIG